MERYIVNQETNTIVRLNDKKIVYFGYRDFVNQIVQGDCCFICGATRIVRPFNDEHVIPEWILRRFNLFSRSIVLPNGMSTKYSSYTVPCCVQCNSELGVSLEKPISILLKKCYEDIVADLEKNRELVQLLYRWVCLTYFKTHLKDTTLLLELDKRKNSGTIGETYDWTNMHHMY
jgi:hypothetical protein